MYTLLARFFGYDPPWGRFLLKLGHLREYR